MKNNTAIVLLLLSVGLFYTFTNVQYRDVKELNKMANEYQSLLSNISQIIELKEGLLATYATISKSEIDRMNKVLPDNVNIVRLAHDLDNMASKYGVSISDVRTSAGANLDANLIVVPGNEDNYDKATVTFGFVSNYANFKKFLSDIEKNLRIMDIKSISFQSGESGLYDYEVSAVIYWLK